MTLLRKCVTRDGPCRTSLSVPKPACLCITVLPATDMTDQSSETGSKPQVKCSPFYLVVAMAMMSRHSNRTVTKTAPKIFFFQFRIPWHSSNRMVAIVLNWFWKERNKKKKKPQNQSLIYMARKHLGHVLLDDRDSEKSYPQRFSWLEQSDDCYQENQTLQAHEAGYCFLHKLLSEPP